MRKNIHFTGGSRMVHKHRIHHAMNTPSFTGLGSGKRMMNSLGMGLKKHKSHHHIKHYSQVEDMSHHSHSHHSQHHKKVRPLKFRF
jgi:hypothetical protein